jgi:hypothetical protein
MRKPMLTKLMLKQLARKKHEQEEGRGSYAPALPNFATLRMRQDNQEGTCL